MLNITLHASNYNPDAVASENQDAVEGGNGRWGGRGTEGRMRLYLIFVCVIKRMAFKAYNTITESP